MQGRSAVLFCSFRREVYSYEKMLFIYNPNAGTGVLKPKLADVIDIFVKAGYEVTVYPTQKCHDGTEKMLDCPDGYNLIVCSGGDGTLDEVVSGDPPAQI